MFDPLASSPFAGNVVPSPSTNSPYPVSPPPWPTTPRQPNSPIPNLRRSLTPRPVTPTPGYTSPSQAQSNYTGFNPSDLGFGAQDSASVFGKEPRIYGQPEAGLISPDTTVGSDGTKYELGQPYLRVRITALDKNRRDILIRFDAQTNLANFTSTTYRSVSRSYAEFQTLYDSITYCNPQTIVPAIPLPTTSAPSDEEDDRLVRIMLQRWLSRVCEDPVLMKDEELRSFIESDFAYVPMPGNVGKRSALGSMGMGAGGFNLLGRKSVLDEDEELQRKRFELTKVEGLFFDVAKGVDKVAKARRVLANSLTLLSSSLHTLSAPPITPHPPLSHALNSLSRALGSLSDIQSSLAVSSSVIIGDTFGYEAFNARSAKETLLMRAGVLEEYHAAVKNTIRKRREIERLKAGRSIKKEKVDEIVEDMEEANKHEQILAHRVDGISHNLHLALGRHQKIIHEDVSTALIEHTRAMLMYSRQILGELEAVRADVENADKKVEEWDVAVVAGGAGAKDGMVRAKKEVPRPKFIPPLEDFGAPGVGTGTTSSGGAGQQQQRGMAASVSGPLPPLPPTPNSALSQQSHGQSASVSTLRPNTIIGPAPVGRAGGIPGPLQPQPQLPSQLQSPGAGPSTPVSASMSPRLPAGVGAGVDPLLGGRPMDGTRSMFVAPSNALGRTGTHSTPGTPQLPASASASAYLSPQRRDPLSPATSQNGLASPGLVVSPGTPGTPGMQSPNVLNKNVDPLSRPSSAFASSSMPPSMSTPNIALPSSPLGPLDPQSPLHPQSHTLAQSTSSVYDPLSPSSSISSPGGYSNNGVSPRLGSGPGNFMSQSMRLPNQQQRPPARPRLDAREAASKLANF